MANPQPQPNDEREDPGVTLSGYAHLANGALPAGSDLSEDEDDREAVVSEVEYASLATDGSAEEEEDSLQPASGERPPGVSDQRTSSHCDPARDRVSNGRSPACRLGQALEISRAPDGAIGALQDPCTSERLPPSESRDHQRLTGMPASEGPAGEDSIAANVGGNRAAIRAANLAGNHGVNRVADPGDVGHSTRLVRINGMEVHIGGVGIWPSMDAIAGSLEGGAGGKEGELRALDSDEEEEEERIRGEQERAVRDAQEADTRRRSAPLDETHRMAIMEAMRRVSLGGFTPEWAKAGSEEDWVRRLSEKRESRRQAGSSRD